MTWKEIKDKINKKVKDEEEVSFLSLGPTHLCEYESPFPLQKDEEVELIFMREYDNSWDIQSDDGW